MVTGHTLAVLVGEDNPYGGDPRFALYPEPGGSAGQRLCGVVLGMHRVEYLRRFHRVNLCVGRWRIGDARQAAHDLRASTNLPLVLLGARVCEAFAIAPFSSCVWDVVRESAGCGGFAVLPHPSGRSRAWNRPAAVHMARDAVSRLLGFGELPARPGCALGKCACRAVASS